MPKQVTFTQISRRTRDTMVANFVETIGNLQALECSHLGEIMDACELIGAGVRDRFVASGNQGLLLFARLIIERANRSNH